MERVARELFIFLYSLLMIMALPLVRMAGWVRRDLAAQLKDRPKLAETGRRIGKARARKKKAVLIFASSAGEYEQAKPLIDRLQRDPEMFVHIVFFSRSGAHYAATRKEQTSWCLAPADTIWHWGWLFSAVDPDATVVIRHELWPAFLHTAKEWGPVYLIDAVAPQIHGRGRWLRHLVKRGLLGYFTQIFAVSDKDALIFSESYALPKENMTVTGDTKYDRVLERADAGMAATTKIKQQLNAIFATRRRLVLGSVYPPDWQLAFSAMSSSHSDDWLPILVPHHVDAKSIQNLCDDAIAAGFRPILWSHLERPDQKDRGQLTGPELLVVDRMGMLAEIYGSAEAAYVGGALHAKIHNVLEPAAYDLAISFGPRHDNSVEAVALAAEGLATVIHNAEDLRSWLAALPTFKNGAGTRGFVQRHAGTTDLFLNQTLALPNPESPMLGAQ